MLEFHQVLRAPRDQKNDGSPPNTAPATACHTDEKASDVLRLSHVPDFKLPWKSDVCHEQRA
jgi:hypothetical protein